MSVGWGAVEIVPIAGEDSLVGAGTDGDVVEGWRYGSGCAHRVDGGGCPGP